MAYKYTNFFLKEGVHVILYVEEAKMKPRMFQKMFTIYNRIKTIQYFFFFFWWSFLMLQNISDQRMISFYTLDIHKNLYCNQKEIIL